MSRGSPTERRSAGPAVGVTSRSGIREQTVLICCLIGASQITWGAIVPALPLYLDAFTLSAAMLGPIIAAFGLGRIVANIPAGMGLRWWRPRPYLVTVACALSLVTAVTGLSADVGTLIALRVVAGVLGGAAVTIGFAVLIVGSPPERRGSAMATATAVQMSAGALGSLLGGAMLTVGGIPSAFAAASVPLVLCVVWDAARPANSYWQPATAAGSSVAPSSDTASRPASAASTSAASASAASATAASTSAVRVWSGRTLAVVGALSLASFAVFFARFGGEQGLIPVLAYGQGGLTPLTLGFALAASTVVSLAAMPVVARIVDRGQRLRVFVPASLVAAAAMLVLPLFSGPLPFAAVVVLYGLAGSVAGVIPSVITGESVPARSTGTVVGITRSAGDLGAVAGPLVVFAAFDASGAVWAVVSIATLLVVSTVVLAVVSARAKPPGGPGACARGRGFVDARGRGGAPA